MSSMAVMSKLGKGRACGGGASTPEGAAAAATEKTGPPAAAATPTPGATPTPTPPSSPLQAPVLPESCHKQPPVDTLSGGCCGGFATPQFFDKQPVPNLYVGQAPPIIGPQPVYSHGGMLAHDLYKQQAGYIQRQYNSVPVLGFPPYADHNINPVAFLNGNLMYQMPANIFTPPDFAAAIPLNVCAPNFTQCFNKPDENHPYIKKPLNAFMIFRKEQRPIVMAEQKIRDSATVNAIVGQKWKSLTKEQQERYYKEAEKERLLHAQKHPNWSSKYNYGKSKMKNRKNKERAPTDDKKPMGVCVTEPFAALVLTPAPSPNQMMLMEHANHLALPAPSLFLRHPNSLA